MEREQRNNVTFENALKRASKQLEFDFDFGVTKEQACVMCHLSSECFGCCVKCKAEDKNGTCGGQSCSLQSRDTDGQRWDAWMYLVATSLPELKKFIPKKYRKSLKLLYGNN